MSNANIALSGRQFKSARVTLFLAKNYYRLQHSQALRPRHMAIPTIWPGHMAFPALFFLIKEEEILLTRRGYYKERRGQEILNTKSRINKKYIKRAMLSNLSAYQREPSL